MLATRTGQVKQVSLFVKPADPRCIVADGGVPWQEAGIVGFGPLDRLLFRFLVFRIERAIDHAEQRLHGRSMLDDDRTRIVRRVLEHDVDAVALRETAALAQLTEPARQHVLDHVVEEGADVRTGELAAANRDLQVKIDEAMIFEDNQNAVVMLEALAATGTTEVTVTVTVLVFSNGLFSTILQDTRRFGPAGIMAAGHARRVG